MYWLGNISDMSVFRLLSNMILHIRILQILRGAYWISQDDIFADAIWLGHLFLSILALPYGTLE